MRIAVINIRSSLWFVPALFIIGGIVLALLGIEVDTRFGSEFGLNQWSHQLFITRPEGARATLSVIAGSAATIAGVVFSMTIVVLSLASGQYTSRILRNFMQDRSTQVVLGVLVGVFTYCLLVLRTISGGEKPFVPTLSVMLAVMFAIAAICCFIYFIHHISSSIQAGEIAASITKETLTAIERLFPSEIGEGPEEDETAEIPAGMYWYSIPSLSMGYIQSLDPEGLLRFAQEHDTVVRMERGIGEFVFEGRPLASLALYSPPEKNVIKKLNGIYAIASYRTISEDTAFGVRQLVDISLKGLSPGINDTTTAVVCIEHLGALLAHLAPRSTKSRYRFDQDKLRVIGRGPTFESLVSMSFMQINENAEGNTEVMLCVLKTIKEIAKVTRNRQRLDILQHQVDAVAQVAKRSAKTEAAAKEIAKCLEETIQTLKGGTAAS